MATLKVKANDFERTFSSIEEYEEIRDEYFELCFVMFSLVEFKFDFVDGSVGERQLFDELYFINSDDVRDYFEIIEMNYRKQAAIWFAASLYTSPYPSTAIKNSENATLYEGDAVSAAAELFEERYADQIPRNLHCYFDMEKFAKELEREGDFVEFEFDGDLYTCTNASSI